MLIVRIKKAQIYPSGNRMDVTISIVSYYTKDLLRRCLKSIFKYAKGLEFEVIVVDNASEDGSSEMVDKEFRTVKLIKNKTNKYYTGANNQALKITRGKYFLILNADTYFMDNSIKKIFDYMESNKNVGAVEGLELYEDGRLVPNGSRVSTPLLDFYELSLVGKRLKNQNMINIYRIVNKKRNETFEIDIGCDAFLCVRTDILRKIGGYDTNLLLYYTENDLCLRIKSLGYNIVHLGSAKVMHEVSASAKKMGWKKFDLYYRDLLTYYTKHGYKISGFLLFSLLKFEETLFKLFRPTTGK